MKSVPLKEAWSGEADCRHCTLRQSALFAGLKESDLDHIHDFIDRFNLPPGSSLYRTDDPGDSMFTLRSGLVKLVQYLPDGTPRIVRLARTADVLGLECLVEPQYHQHATVLQHAQVCRYPTTVVRRLSADNPRLFEELMNRWHRALAEADTWLTDKCVFDLVMRFGTSKSPKRTRSLTAYYAPTVLRSSRFRIAHCSYAARALLQHDSHNDTTACRMRSLYALHRSLSVAIPAIQPRLRLSETNRLRFALHGGQRLSTGSAKQRVARLIIHLSNPENSRCELFSREDMAAMLGITTETASRTMAGFKRQSLLVETSHNVFLIDIPNLRRLADE